MYKSQVRSGRFVGILVTMRKMLPSFSYKATCDCVTFWSNYCFEPQIDVARACLSRCEAAVQCNAGSERHTVEQRPSPHRYLQNNAGLMCACQWESAGGKTRELASLGPRARPAARRSKPTTLAPWRTTSAALDAASRFLNRPLMTRPP